MIIAYGLDSGLLQMSEGGRGRGRTLVCSDPNWDGSLILASRYSDFCSSIHLYL